MVSSARIDELRKKFDENPRRYFAPLANEYRKVGDLEQAVFICQEYLPQQPGHMSGHIVFGQTLFAMGRFDEAKSVFETALSLDPENLIALRHLGDIARHTGDIAAARNWYQRVLEADPRNEEIAHVMAALL
jgi:tetratricopeptide (TPR) repeat protein